jgi:hypothetical protein
VCAGGVNLQALWRYFCATFKAVAKLARGKALKSGVKPREHLLATQRNRRVHRLTLQCIHPRQAANPALIKFNGTARMPRRSVQVFELSFEAKQSVMPVDRHESTVAEARGTAKGVRANN